MKKVLSLLFIFLYFSQYAYCAECPVYKFLGDLSYQDRVHDVHIILGKIYIKDSKLFFEKDMDGDDVGNIKITDKYKNKTSEKIIEDFGRLNKINSKTKQMLLKQISNEIEIINKNDSIPLNLNDKYLNIKTKKIGFIEFRLLPSNTICDSGFIKDLINDFYQKYDILISIQNNYLSKPTEDDAFRIGNGVQLKLK